MIPGTLDALPSRGLARQLASAARARKSAAANYLASSGFPLLTTLVHRARLPAPQTNGRSAAAVAPLARVMRAYAQMRPHCPLFIINHYNIFNNPRFSRIALRRPYAFNGLLAGVQHALAESATKRVRYSFPRNFEQQQRPSSLSTHTATQHRSV